MNPLQRAACAARLPARERMEFLALQDEADRLLALAWDRRASAWTLYRSVVPPQHRRRRKS